MPFPQWNDNEVDLLKKICENTSAASIGGVNSIIAGSGISISPAGGTGAVTISVNPAGPVTSDRFLAGGGTAAAPSFSFQGETDTGMFNQDDNTLDFSLGGVNRLTFSHPAASTLITNLVGGGFISLSDAGAVGLTAFGANQSITLTPTGTGEVLNIAGTAANPSYSFTGDPNTGMFNGAADQVNFALNGVDALRVSLSGGTSTRLTNPTGTNFISFNNNTQTAIFGGPSNLSSLTISSTGAVSITAGATDQGITLSTNGTGVVISTGRITIPAGTAALPSLNFSGDLTTGIYRDAASVIRISIAATRVASFVSSGLQLLAGNTTATAPALSIDGAGNTGLFSTGAGNLSLTAAGTVTGVFSSTAGISLTALGTNQPITLTPSGTGKLLVPIGANVFQYDGGSAAVTPGLFIGSGTTGKAIVFGAGASSAVIAYSTDSTGILTILKDTRANLLAGTYGTTVAKFGNTGNLLLGGLTTDGVGVLQFPAATTSAGGITFGVDTQIYRRGTGAIALDSTSGTLPDLSFYETGARKGFIQTSAGVMNLGTVGATATVLYTNATIALTIDASQNSTFAGGVLMTVAKPLTIPAGTNKRAGNLTLVAGTATVSNTTVTANSLVFLTRKTSGGTLGTAITYTLSAGTSFTVNSDSALDTSTFSYVLIENP